MFHKIYLEPAHHRKHRACVQIAEPCVHFASRSYRIMRKSGVNKWDARTCVFLLIHVGQLSQRYALLAANIPEEAVGAF